jgi:hypothetical protein
MRQLLIIVNSVFTQIETAKNLLFILVFVMSVGGCASPGAIVPGQTEFVLKDKPLVVFTLQLSLFPQPARMDLVILDNATNESKYYWVWGNMTNKKQQQDYSNQIITLQLNQGSYTIEKLILSESTSIITIPLNGKFMAKDSTVSYVGNIHIVKGNAIKNLLKSVLLGREQGHVQLRYIDNYDSDIIDIKNKFPCLKNINIENQSMAQIVN